MERMTGAELRAARQRLALSGETLANRLDVRGDTLRRWENGREPIPYRVPSEIADVAEDLAREALALADEIRRHAEWVGRPLSRPRVRGR